MHILITGGTGFIGSYLCPALLADGHQLTLLTRRPQKALTTYGERLRAVRRLDEIRPDERLDAVINLAGEGIADRPWTSQRKQELFASRVTLTEELVVWLKRREQKPTVMLQGSAVGWYGNQGDKILEEDADAVPEFTHRLCRDWEAAARPVERQKIRLCILRTGLVLGAKGGMLKRMLPLFGLGLGAKLGSGEQYMSWIAASDYVAIVRFLLGEPGLAGVFNVTAPKPVANAEFTRTLAQQLHRPALLSVPVPVLRIGMGEMADLLLHGQRVLPSRLLSARFAFKYRTLDEALKGELGGA